MNLDTLGLIAIGLILFLLGREIVCWYFKINHRMDLLEEIRDLLKENKESLVPAETKTSKKKPVKADEDFFYKDNEKPRVIKVSDGEVSIVDLDEKDK